MAGLEDFSLQLRGAGKGGVKIIELKPQENAVSIRFDIWIPDWPMMVLNIPSVQLKDQAITRDQSLILGAAMRTLTAKETLIPATARLNISHAN